jgi:hypothetical protein
MARRRPQRPRDPNQLGKLIVDLSTGEVTESAPPTSTPASDFARLGGLRGGRARAEKLSPAERRAIAKAAARARWQKGD